MDSLGPGLSASIGLAFGHALLRIWTRTRIWTWTCIKFVSGSVGLSGAPLATGCSPGLSTLFGHLLDASNDDGIVCSLGMGQNGRGRPSRTVKFELTIE